MSSMPEIKFFRHFFSRLATMPDLNNQVKIATKWALVAEICSKLVSPVTTMILARLLAPTAFGIMVTATMIISFAELFTDAGFQKYLIQKKFEDRESLINSTNVAFWSNLILSIVLWLIICVFSKVIAHLVGCDGYHWVIIVSCVCIPLEAFSSIQMALFKKDLDFKTLFYVRLLGIFVPLFVTIPIAYFTGSYWALIIGMIASNLCNAVILTYKSSWKPSLYYNIELFKQMFSFSSWSMIESVSIWLTLYLDVFIVGSVLNTYYMGLYRTSISTVSALFTIIISSTTPVLFSALSKLQSDESQFRELFFKFQRLVGLFVFPMGVLVFFFSDLCTNILLGEQWDEAALFFGWWGLTNSLSIVTVNYCGEVYRAKGKPKITVFTQWCHLVFLVPVVLISIDYGYDTLCISRSLARLQLILVNLVALYIVIRISFTDMIRNLKVPILGSLLLVGLLTIIPKPDSILLQLLYMSISALIYLLFVCSFKDERAMILNIKSSFIR